MENKISRLENYTVQDKAPGSAAEKRCRFYYLENDYLWKEFDIEGHYNLDEAFEYAKDVMLNDLIKMALNESVKSLDLKSKHFHFTKDGEVEDLRDYVFDKDILDEDSQLFNEFKKLLLNNWNDDMAWYYFLVGALKNAKIHDDNDKKTLYNHYFDSLKEFNERQSFLEYASGYDADWEGSGHLRRIHYNFIEYGDYHCIDNSVTREDLKRFVITNGNYIPDDYYLSNLTVWQVFGYYYGKNNGLSELESISFGFTLGLFFTNGFAFEDIFKDPLTGEKFKRNKYFKESTIDDVALSIVSRRVDGSLTDHTREIFFTIFDIYKNRIQEFEYKTKRLEFRVSQRQFDQFMSLEGKSKADKLNSLMTYPIEEVENSLLPGIDLSEASLEKWKESNKSTADYDLTYIIDWLCAPRKTLEEIYGDGKEVRVINSETGVLSPEEKSLIPTEEELEWIRREEEERAERELMKEIEEDAKEYQKYMELLRREDPEEYEKTVKTSELVKRVMKENPDVSIREVFKRINEEFTDLKDKYPDASVEEIFEEIGDLKF